MMMGDNLVPYYHYNRVTGFEQGWRSHLYPELPGSPENEYLFDNDLNLVVLPIVKREKVKQEEWRSDDDPKMTAAVYVKPVLATLAQNTDPSNVPQSEKDENRLAWMGVELQPLNKELARINRVSDLTNNGENGALVSYVYPDSPASGAGVQAGYVLLRLHSDDVPKPIEVKLSSYETTLMEHFPWDKIDMVPSEYLDRLPTPWPNVENTFNRTLTDLGFGKKYRADFFNDGKLLTREFVVRQSPPYFASSPQYKSTTLGLTVKDLTYEVRRHYKKNPADSGVIVVKVEKGGKAAVGGIKPYEIITQINESAVNNVKDFETLTGKGGAFRFSVHRLTKERIVKIKMPAAATQSVPAPKTPDLTTQTASGVKAK